MKSLSVDGVTFAFKGEAPLVEQLSFDVQPCEFVAILGPSGTGKSTLFQLIAGLLEPDSGQIRLGDGGAEAKRIGQVGYMPQKDLLLPWRSVLDNAALGLEFQGLPRRTARARVQELLPSFGLEGTERKLPHELSGGMRQRVSFLRTMLAGGGLLLLDEPFSALDALTRVSMQEWLLGIWERHRMTVLFITHDIDEALLLSDRVLIVHKTPISGFAEFPVPAARPRKYESLLEPETIRLKKQILQSFGAVAAGAGEGA